MLRERKSPICKVRSTAFLKAQLTRSINGRFALYFAPRALIQTNQKKQPLRLPLFVVGAPRARLYADRCSRRLHNQAKRVRMLAFEQASADCSASANLRFALAQSAQERQFLKLARSIKVAPKKPSKSSVCNLIFKKRCAIMLPTTIRNTKLISAQSVDECSGSFAGFENCPFEAFIKFIIIFFGGKQ